MAARKSRGEKLPRRRGTRRAKQPRREARENLYVPPVTNLEGAPLEELSPEELYRLEKARRAGEAPPHAEVLREAHREYRAMLEADAAKGKGGRPRKTAPRAKPAPEEPEGEEGEDEEE